MPLESRIAWAAAVGCFQMVLWIDLASRQNSTASGGWHLFLGAQAGVILGLLVTWT